MASRRELLINTFGFHVAHLPVKYLGIQLASRVLKTTAAHRKIHHHLKKWNGKTLYFVGRLEMIRACVQGVEAYLAASLPNCWHGHNPAGGDCKTVTVGSKFSKVAGKDICLPREEGGLGLRDLDSWNTTLHATILWNIFAKKDTLWIQWVDTHIFIGLIGLSKC